MIRLDRDPHVAADEHILRFNAVEVILPTSI